MRKTEKSTTWEYLIIFESPSVGFIFELGMELRDTGGVIILTKSSMLVINNFSFGYYKKSAP